MNELTLNAVVEQTLENDSISFTITGPVKTADAIKRMVSAHTQMMESADNPLFTNSEIENRSDGVVLTLATNSEKQFTKLKALGFIGFMATGSHHQQHHLMIALGSAHH